VRLAVTGFVEAEAGSVASANALLLGALLDRGVRVDFFSKASFVDPRPIAGNHPGFTFHDTDNRIPDRLRRKVAGWPVAGLIARMLDVWTYNRLVVRSIREASRRKKFDACLWMGDYARGSIPGIPTVSMGQGPPGTDARSVINRFDEIRRLAGLPSALKWSLLALARLSRIGLPVFGHSDHIIVASSRSLESLHSIYRVPLSQVSVLPFPLALEKFRFVPGVAATGPLRCLWLGRIVPRKRIDLFLDGAATVIRSGTPLALTVVGKVGFIRGYERLIETFPFPGSLKRIDHVDRSGIPDLLRAHDVLVQPSEEEDFGSSVAEAQACGIPVIVGATNGTGDYLCRRDLRLSDYQPETLCKALIRLAALKANNAMGDPSESRRSAEEHFSAERVAERLVTILKGVVVNSTKAP